MAGQRADEQTPPRSLIRRHRNFFLPEIDPYPARFALDEFRIGLQRVDLFLQSQIFVLKTLNLPGKA